MVEEQHRGGEVELGVTVHRKTRYVVENERRWERQPGGEEEKNTRRSPPHSEHQERQDQDQVLLPDLLVDEKEEGRPYGRDEPGRLCLATRELWRCPFPETLQRSEGQP